MSPMGGLNNFSVACWNARGIMYGVNYADELLRTRNIDVLGICEHWLYPSSLSFLNSINSSYNAYGVSDNDLFVSDKCKRGKGGVALMWKKHLAPNIRVLDLDSDRVIGISLSFALQRSMFIFMAYLPSSCLPVDVYIENIDYLHQLFEFYSPIGEIILMGDLNAQIRGKRTPNVISCQRTRALQALLNSVCLHSIPVEGECLGPPFSFDPFEGASKTLIDHICVSDAMLEGVLSNEIIDDEPLNTSDHLPVIAVLQHFSDTQETPMSLLSRKRFQWKRCLQMDFGKIVSYRQALNHELSHIQLNSTRNIAELDGLYDYIISAISSAAELTIPKKGCRKRCRPGWNDNIKHLHKSMLTARQIWIIAGKPRNLESVERLSYKECKRTFRAALRKLDSHADNEFYNNLDSAAEVDQKLFWKLLKNHRRTQNQMPPPMRFDGKVYYNPKDISQKWAQYFERTFTPDESDKYDESFRKKVEHDIQIMQKDSFSTFNPPLDKPFTVDEVQCAIKTLKHDKACGFDDISNEHLKYGGYALHAALTALFNMILEKSHVPKKAKQGVIHTLYKGKGKDKSDPRSYRPITLLPALYKLLEKLTLSRINEWISENDIQFPNKQQSAYQHGRSCVSTSFVLQETIAHMLERNSKVYVCFLDTARAFDSVWQNGLLFKVFKLGIQGLLWRLIKACYSDTESCVVENNIYSDWFTLRQGVRQGGVLSTWLYTLYIDELLDNLDNLGTGTTLDDINCGSPCHADDLTLLSIFKYGLDSMLSSTFSYSRKWRYEFNFDKCSIMVFGESPHQWAQVKEFRTWMLGPKPIAEVTSTTHLGFTINKYMKATNIVISAAQKLKGSMMSILGPGIQPNSFNPICCLKLYKLICLPRALYGSELWFNLSASDILIIERAHRFCLKRMQGFHRSTRTAIAQSMIGAYSMSAMIEEKCLLFFSQLCKLSEESLPLKIFALRYKSYVERKDKVQLGYVPYLFKALDKYSHRDILENFMQYQELPELPANDTLKSLFKKSILKFENNLFVQQCEDNNLHRTLRIEISLSYPSLLWTAAREYPEIKDNFSFLARLSTLTVQNIENPLLCSKCNRNYTDPHIHFFCECQGYTENRELFWTRIEEEFPVDLSAELWSMGDSELSETLLARQLVNFDYCTNIELLKIVAECWMVKN